MGDVTGDGLPDIAIAAAGNTVEGFPYNSGSVHLFNGTVDGDRYFRSDAQAIYTATVEEKKFGWDVTGTGDMNGDGLGELLVGTRSGGIDPDEGGAYFFLGPHSGTQTTADADVIFTVQIDGEGGAAGGEVFGMGAPLGLDGTGLLVSGNGLDYMEDNVGGLFYYSADTIMTTAAKGW